MDRYPPCSIHILYVCIKNGQHLSSIITGTTSLEYNISNVGTTLFKIIKKHVTLMISVMKYLDTLQSYHTHLQLTNEPDV